MEFNETWQEARSQRPLQILSFSGRSEKQDGRPGLWLAETFPTSPLKPLNGIQWNLTGSKISTSSTKFVFFRPIRKTRWPPWPLIGWDIFDFTSETAERYSTKLDRKQDLNVLYKVFVFRADRKNKMAALAFDWLRHFQLLLWNRWTEFNETWQKARSQSPLQSLCFSGWSEKQDGRPGLWLAETYSTSPLKPLKGIQRNLTGSKISMSSTKFLFFGLIGKARWPPWPLIGWDIFDFSSETAERNLTKLDRKQDLNVLYQDCVFRANWKIKMATLASDWLRHFQLHLWIRWTEFNETWQEERSQRPLPSLCFSGRSEKQNGCSGQSIKMVAHCTQVHDMWPFGPLVSSPEPRLKWAIVIAHRPSSVRKLSHFQLLLWNRRMEFNETWQDARSQRPLPSLCFSDWSEKQNGCPSLWLAETFSTSSLKPINRIQRNLTGSKISKSSTKFVFFGPVGKKIWLPYPLIGWDIFYFFSEIAERNSTKLDRKQDLNVLYQVSVFRADRKSKMAALASDWLRHFRLLLWNRWTEFDETWQEARSQCPLPRLCFSSRSEN